MRLISLLLYLIAQCIDFTSATTLFTTFKSLKGLPTTHANNNAHSTDTHTIDTLVRSSSQKEKRDSGSTPAAIKDGHLASTFPVYSASSLNRWGSSILGASPGKLEYLLNARSTERRSSFGRFAILLVTAAVLITCASCLCGCFGRWWDSDDDETKGPDPTLAAVEYCNGPWATAYRESHGPQREAIELLFRCNIITMPEFAGHVMSYEHGDVNRCVQIGVRMLEERSSSEWEAHWQEAHRYFQQAIDGDRYSRA